MDQDDIRQAIEAHQSNPRDGYGEPIDHVIEDCCSEWGVGDYMLLALAAAGALAPRIGGIALRHAPRERAGLQPYILTFEAVKGAMLDSLIPQPEHVIQALAAVSGAVDQLRLMLAALDQAGLSVAGQRAVVRLLQESASW